MSYLKKEILKKTAVFSISSFLCLLLFFLIVSLLAKKDNLRNQEFYSSVDWEDKDINDIPSKKNYRKIRCIRGTNKTFEIRINSQGFRDYEYKLTKYPGIIRIAVVGDSVTFGEGGVELDDTYVKQLEKILNFSSGRRIEVLNFGSGGASTINELELIEKKVLLYKPDILILQMDPNDSNIISQIKKEDPFLNKIILKLKQSELAVSSWLKCKLELYKYYRYRKTMTLEEEYNNVVDPLKMIIGICQERDIKLAVISYDPVYRGSYYDKVIEYIKSQGIPLLDLAKTQFGKLSFEEKYVNPNLDKSNLPIDSHPNKNGGRIIAEEIAQFVNLIPDFWSNLLTKDKSSSAIGL